MNYSYLKYYIRIYALIIILILLSYNSTIKASSSISFVALGHLYPITNDNVKLEKLIVKVKSLTPDYIFILGDSSLTDKTIYNKFNQILDKKVYFVPGNNELIGGTLKDYENNVGYINYVIDEKEVRFILLNSLDSASNINKYLHNVNKNKGDKLQIILTHHRIWDDTLTSEYPYEHDKSYYFKDIYSEINGKVSAIFSGNSKRQYFTDTKKNNVAQNVNNIFYVDQIGEIECYSVGTGDAFPKLGFVYVKIQNKQLSVKPFHINYLDIDPVPLEIIKPTSGSIAPAIKVDNIIHINGNNSYPSNYIFYIKSKVQIFLQYTPKRHIMLFGFITGVLLTMILVITYNLIFKYGE
jgi:hypothetical protein